jgi:hypothetical protein
MPISVPGPPPSPSHVAQPRAFLPPGLPRFLIVTPTFSHRSAGVRALFRLCHHLNRSGYPAAVIPRPGHPIVDYPRWDVFGYQGPIDDAVVIYPEIVSGNPYQAERVVRWVLNDPGLLGGDTRYAETEVVFAYDPQKLGVVNSAVSRPIGPRRVLWVGVVDPDIIYPDPTVIKDIDCSFENKGRHLRSQFPLAPSLNVNRLEELTPDGRSLGDVLRRTRTLYSYDHYSNVLREAAICGCQVRAIDRNGVWHDPEHCNCPLNCLWAPEFRKTYRAQFHDSSVVKGFVAQLPPSWSLPAPSRLWRLWLLLSQRGRQGVSRLKTP